MVERVVLVTRPAERAAPLCLKLQQAGYQAVALPMMEIIPVTELTPGQLQLLQDLDHFQRVILVSSNAVRLGMNWITQYWPQLPAGLDWYTVGATSAGELGDYGVPVQYPETDMSSEGLLALASLQQVVDERVLIIKGEGGRTLLSEALRERGARVEELSLYRRSGPPVSAEKAAAVLQENRFAAVVFSSGEGLGNMLSLLPPEARRLLREIPAIVPGPRVAQLAEDVGFRTVYTARNATDKAIMETLLQGPGSEERSG